MNPAMNLFVVYVGGKTETSLIEVHDIHFALGEKIEDTYDQIRKQWWGTPQSLHLDAWGIVKSVEDYNIALKAEPETDQAKKLFFINLGGYDANEFTELHKNMFVIASDEGEAKIKAKSTITHWTVPHKDNLYAIDDCINVNDLLKKQGLAIHLEPTNNPEPFKFTCKYVPISK
jgi:hypothetical protein